jgi:glycerophosphoryl diester phosphodiesterase
MPLSRLSLAVVCFLVALGLLAPPAEAARAGNFNAIAHRGYHRHHTENTIGALKAAHRHHATAVEGDVRLTRDRKMIMMHDRTLRRTTRCRGAVHRHTRHWIKRHCRANDGSRGPSLRQYLRAARHRHLNLMLELKVDPRGRWTKHRVRAFKRLVHGRHMAHRVTVLSFSARLLRRVDHIAPGLPTVWVARHKPSVRRAKHNADRITVGPKRLSRRYVRRMHHHGVRVYGLHNDRVRVWRRYHRAGVDGISVNRLRRFIRWEANH